MHEFVQRSDPECMIIFCEIADDILQGGQAPIPDINWVITLLIMSGF